MKKLTLFFIAFIATLQIQATHIIGGQITSRCLGGLTQEITTTLYVDIQGIPMNNTILVSYASSTFPWIFFNHINYSTQYSINSTTNAYEFIDTITVPYVDYYTYSFSTCCRAANVVNINQVSSPFYIETIALVDSTCNSTPIIPIVQFPYATVNIQSIYNLNAYDLDGDSLVYNLVTPLDNNNSPMVGFLTPPVTISNTGVLTVYSTTMGVYVFCVKVTEYRNGIEIGYLLREMQVTVDMLNGINEINNRSNSNYKYYDVLGREVRQDYGVLKIEQK